MRTPALTLLSAAAACRILDPSWCPERKPDITCEEGQDAVVSGKVDYVFYWHCSMGVHFEDAGYKATPDRCDLRAKCDGGHCPDVGMAIE
jgi:hypothetical protein